MISKFLIGAGILIVLTACTTNRIPEELRTDLHIGEANYFQSRCPQYKKIDIERAFITYCLANKFYNNGCNPQKTARSFVEGSFDGFMQAKVQYQYVADNKVCSIAESKYGTNGSVIKRFLTK